MKPILNYSEDQPRAADGEFGSGGGGSKNQVEVARDHASGGGSGTIVGKGSTRGSRMIKLDSGKTVEVKSRDFMYKQGHEDRYAHQGGRITSNTTVLTLRKAGLISNDTASTLLTTGDTADQHEAKADSLRSLARVVPDIKKKIDLHQRAAKHTTAAQQMRGGNRDLVKNRAPTQDANGLFTKGGGDYQSRAATHITKRDFHNQQAAKLETKASDGVMKGKYAGLTDGAKAAAHHAAADLHQQAATALLQAGGRSERTGDGTDAMALSHQANAASARIASGSPKGVATLAKNWSEDQERAPNGQFGSGGGSSKPSEARTSEQHLAAAEAHYAVVREDDGSLSESKRAAHLMAQAAHEEAAHAMTAGDYGSKAMAAASRLSAPANRRSAKLGM